MKYKLEDMCIKITDGSHYSPIDDPTSSIPMLSVKDMEEFDFNYNNCKHISEEEYNKMLKNDCVPKLYDVLVAKDGSYLKEIFVNAKENKKAILSSIAIFRPNQEIVDPYFLCYLLKTPMILNYVKDNCVSGSALPRIILRAFKGIELMIPEIKIQRRIVKIIKNINDKIKINNEINNNLYEFAIKYLNEMQSDEEVTLSKFGKIQGGYAFKSKDLLDTKTNNRIIKIKNLRNEISADVINSQFVENEVIDKLDNKFKIKKGNVAIAMTGAELGKTGFIYGFDDYYLNQRVGLVRGITKEKELYLNILLLSQEFQDLLNSKGYGSAQPNVSTADIENITIQNIEDDDLMKFYEKVSPIYKKIILNCEENLNLEQLRDTLLPKLMNGEIDLDNIEL